MVKLLIDSAGRVVGSPEAGFLCGYDSGALNAVDWGEILVSTRNGRIYLTIEKAPEGADFGIFKVTDDVTGAVAHLEEFGLEVGADIDVGPESVLSDLAAWTPSVAPASEGVDGIILVGEATRPTTPVEQAPARPAPPSITPATGAAAGQITITFNAPPPSPGDGATGGDGLGTITGYRYRIDGGAPVSIGNPAFPTTITVSGLVPDAIVTVDAMTIGGFRDSAWSNPQDVRAKETPVIPGNPPVYKGTIPAQILVAGNSLSLNLAPHFDNSPTSFAIEDGLTGGLISGTNYVVGTLVQETKTVRIRANNDFGFGIAEFNATVAAAIVAPAWRAAAIPDVIVPIGGTIDVDLNQYLTAGTQPISWSFSPANANVTIDANGRFKNTGPLNSAIALTTLTITASNSAGSPTKQLRFRVVGRAAKPDVVVNRAVYVFGGETWRKPVLRFTDGDDVAAGVTGWLWSTRTPDANGVIDPVYYENLILTNSSPREYQPVMTESGRNGNPDTQTVAVNLGADPFTTVNGQTAVTCAATAHGLAVGWLVRFTGHVNFNGITIPSNTGIAITSVPNANSFTFEVAAAASAGGAGGGGAVVMTPNRRDYSCFSAGETRGNNLYIATIDSLGIVSEWAGALTVPTVTVTPPTGASDIALPFILRPTGTYNRGGSQPPLVGSPGMQFQHAVCWNLGRNDPDKAGYAFFGQDENNCSFTPDYGATTAALNVLGMCGSKIGGIWANSDDNVIAILCGAGFNTGYSGLYISRDWGKTARRMDLSGWANTQYISEGGRMSVNQNLIDRRPQRAPDQTQLTHAQRPAYWVEQRHSGFAATSPVDRVRLWRSTDNFQTAEVVYTFTVGQVASGEYGLYYLKVAPNGDVLVGGRNGVWFSDNADSGSVTFTKIYDGTIRGLAVYGIAATEGGDTFASNAKSAAYIATQGSIRRTLDAGNVAFSIPGGQNLPNNTITQVQCAQWNPQRVYCTLTISNSSGRGYVSTNGGASFTEVSSSPQDGDLAGRWGWQQRAAGIYPHPYDSTKMIGFTSQSFTRSQNGTSFDGDLTAFWDKTHIKGGIGFHRTDPQQIGIMCQDRGPMTCHDGAESVYATYISRTEKNPGFSNAVQISENRDPEIRDYVLAISGGQGQADTGRLMVPFPNRNDRWLAAWCTDGGAVKAVPVIHTHTSTSNNGTRNYAHHVRNNVGFSYITKQFWSPVEADVYFAGKWVISNWTASNLNQIDFGSSARECAGYSFVGGAFRTYWMPQSLDATQIFRSTENRGGGQTSWKSGLASFSTLACAVDVGYANGRVLFSPHGQGGNAAERLADSGKIFKVEGNGSGVAGDATLVVNLRTEIKNYLAARGLPTSDAVVPATPVWQIEANPTAPGVFYASIECCGVPPVWEIKFASNGDVTVIPLRGLPLTIMWIRCSQLTGELFVMGSQGTYIFEAPEETPNSLANRNHYTDWLDTFYARSDVPNASNMLTAA
ncbi:MAG: hypothetical protein BWX64_01443 [Acidobacteria bacterium ADurb.Bin051]|nr:MAG: hypothetical protein BWX64_01443 [Acidobacteria bacterium ADurb.Bin051]